VFLHRCDADFELEAFVDFVLLELAQLGVEAIYLPSEVGLHAVDLCIELVEARLDCPQRVRDFEVERLHNES
jgi:hypothetical protein